MTILIYFIYCLWSVTPANGIKVIDKCSVDTMLITNCLEICHLPFQNQSYFENLFYETDIPSHSSSVRTQTGMHPGKTGKNRGSTRKWVLSLDNRDGPWRNGDVLPTGTQPGSHQGNNHTHTSSTGSHAHIEAHTHPPRKPSTAPTSTVSLQPSKT